jgi:hypothetical protein
VVSMPAVHALIVLCRSIFASARCLILCSSYSPSIFCWGVISWFTCLRFGLRSASLVDMVRVEAVWWTGCCECKERKMRGLRGRSAVLYAALILGAMT